MAALEPALLMQLRRLATHPAALGFADDAAILDWPLGARLVATHDMLAEGVHFTPQCPPADVGWKLAAVNLSDLAAMGARPVAVLMGAGIGTARDLAWAQQLLTGLAQALTRHTVPLIGGDTIRTGATSTLALTALGQLPPDAALTRAGAAPGDELWVSGTIGDAGLGLQAALGQRPPVAALLRRYRRPTPRMALGHALLGLATAAIDISDGLLIDAARLAKASGVVAAITANAIPLSAEARATGLPPADLAAMGDDYELLFTAPPAAHAAVEAAAAATRTPVTRIGTMGPSDPAALPPVALAPVTLDGAAPRRLGYQHQ